MNVSSFPGKTILLTGAASGIGAATARLLAEAGARVLLSDLRPAALEPLAAELKAEALELDVSSEAHWTRAAESLRERGLDALVHCAGISFAAPLVDMRFEDWRRVLAVNLDGAFLALKHGLPLLRPGGAVVLVSSASGLKAAPGASAYAASKAALLHLSRCAALEAAPQRIRVNTVCPAGVETPMWEDMAFFQELLREKGGAEAAYAALAESTPLRRFAKAGEVARAICYLASDEAAYITGTELVIDGGYTA